MTDSFQSRLREIAKESGGNRALCEKSGVSERTFANWLSGASEPKVIGVAAVAKAAGVTIDWIVNGTLPKEQLGSHRHDHMDMMKIPWLSKEVSGQNFNVDRYMPFSSDFLANRLRQNDFDQLCVLEVCGDALHPTANNGDIALIDRTDTRLADGLVAFVFKGVISIKRIVNRLSGIEVVSDNYALYPPHLIGSDELDQLRVIGRVVWIGKTIT